jgi:hypothetical protein
VAHQGRQGRRALGLGNEELTAQLALSTLKVNNAEPYEELPARELGKSLYVGVTFTPGVTKGGGAVGFDDEVRREASEYLRQAWDKVVDVQASQRGIRRDIEDGNTGSFAAGKTGIVEISTMCGTGAAIRTRRYAHSRSGRSPCSRRRWERPLGSAGREGACR